MIFTNDKHAIEGIGKIKVPSGDATCQHKVKIYIHFININNYINYIFIRVR